MRRWRSLFAPLRKGDSTDDDDDATVGRRSQQITLLDDSIAFNGSRRSRAHGLVRLAWACGLPPRSRMTLARQALGLYGEDIVCRELERRGYALLARRYRTRCGELDIVARHGAWVVFIEVKARHDSSFGDPADAVTLQKQRRLVAMATDYVTRNSLGETPCRFDVAAVDMSEQPPRVTIFDDAFRPGW